MAAITSQPLVLNPDINDYPNPYADILEDPSGKLTLTDILTGHHAFQPYPEENRQEHPFTRSAFWLRISLLNQSEETHWYISVWGSLNKQTQVYARSGHQPRFTALPLLEHSRSAAYTFESEMGMTHTVYLRIQDQQTPLDLSFNLKNSKAMLFQVMAEDPTYVILIGGLMTLALYNMLYFIYLRDTEIFSSVIFVTAFAIEMGNQMGVWHYFKLMRDYLPLAGTSFSFIAIGSAIGFISNLLDLKKNVPFIYQWFRYSFWCCLGLALLSPFMHYGIGLAGVMGITQASATLITLGILYARHYPFPASFILAGTIFLAAMIPTVFMAAGLLPVNSYIIDFTPIAILVATILLSLTQAEQIHKKGEQLERILASSQAKDELLTTMSHELRTPMTAVAGAARLLKLTSLSTLQNEYVARLNTSSEHMLSLIDNTLDLARIDGKRLPLESIPFHLDNILQQTEQLVMEQARRKHLNLVVKNHFNASSKPVSGDPTRLKQVLLNLLSNAIKFTSQGTIKLIVTPIEITEVDVSLLFEVSDSGIGISPEQQQHLFQPFTQADHSTSRKYGGSGLGLAISHKLIDRMGGLLQVQSQADQGSRFFFTLHLPLSDLQPAGAGGMNVSSLSTEALRAFRVLLVDDNEMNRFFGQKLLTLCGVQASIAESGADALRQLQQSGFDLVFMDISMPDMDGYATTRQIRQVIPASQLPIVALTAHAIAGERERCLAAGMNDYLTKPLLHDELLKVLCTWLPGSGGSDRDRIRLAGL